jgi:hypothetical protein
MRYAAQTSENQPQQRVLRADLIGLDLCICAGLAVTSATPVLAMCRTLIEFGVSPGTRLDCHRSGALALIVHHIGAAAIAPPARISRPAATSIAAANEEGRRHAHAR